MERCTIVLVLISMSSACLAADGRADLVRAIQRGYEQDLALLEHDYRTERSLLKSDYVRQRDLLLDKRDQVRHIDCHETRAIRMRAIGREQAELNKAWARANRDLARAYQADRIALREAFMAAIRDAGSSGRRAYVDSLARSHEAACICSDCLTHRTPVVRDYHQAPPKFDWASLVVGLLHSRLGH